MTGIILHDVMLSTLRITGCVGRGTVGEVVCVYQSFFKIHAPKL